MPAIIGLNCVLYRNTGSFGTPVWDVVGNVRDNTLSLETGEADVTTRTNNGWRAVIATLKTASVEFEMVWDNADADFTAIRTAFLTNASLEFLILDGLVATVGSQGLRATCMIGKFTRSEPLEDAVKASVSIKPTFSANAPSWWTSV